MNGYLSTTGPASLRARGATFHTPFLACWRDGSDPTRARELRHIPTRRGRGGFTMIELLVVVTIILILAAILLPTLQKAKEKGLQSHCVNNLRQHAMAPMLYVDDHDGFTPCVRDPSLGYDYGGWMFQLGHYLHVVPTNLNIRSVAFCPVDALGYNANPFKKWRYAMNHDLRYDGAVSNPQPTKKIASVMDASKAMAFTENGMYRDVIHMPALEYAFYGHPAGDYVAGPAHGGKGIGIAYVDGHAEFWRRVPSQSEYMTDRTVPWTHKPFWGMNPVGASSAKGSWATATAPYNP